MIDTFATYHVPCCTWSLELVIESICVFAEHTCCTLEYVYVKMASFEEEAPELVVLIERKTLLDLRMTMRMY
jgi:hypothetical protein